MPIHEPSQQLPESVLAQLPQLSDQETHRALNELGLAPDLPDLTAAYRGCHRRSPQASGVLATLHGLARRHVQQREVADLADVATGTVAHVVERCRQLGVLATEGGEFDPRRGRSSCLRYRWAWSPAIALRPHHRRLAALWLWATGAGVKPEEARRMIASQQLTRLRLRVVTCQQKARARAEAAAKRAAETAALPPAPASPAQGPEALGDILRRVGLPQVEHGDSSSERPSLCSNLSEGQVGINPVGVHARTSARRRAKPGRCPARKGRRWPFSTEQVAEVDRIVRATAERFGDNCSRATVAMLLRRAQEHERDPVGLAEQLYAAASDVAADRRSGQLVRGQPISRPMALAVFRWAERLQEIG